MPMSIARIRTARHRHAISITGCFLVGVLCAWATGTASNPAAGTAGAAPVLISTTLLDMSRLSPAAFGDWE